MRPTTRACRNARKTLNVQGNCCWKIYQRYRYAGDMRIIRGSRTFDLHFVPRSMKIMPCWNTYIPSTLAMMTLRGSRVYILDYFQMYFTFENILRIPKIDCISKCISTHAPKSLKIYHMAPPFSRYFIQWVNLVSIVDHFFHGRKKVFHQRIKVEIDAGAKP